MGRLAILLGLLPVLLQGRGSLAQPRLITDPWCAPSLPAAAGVPLGSLPSSGLPEVGEVLPAVRLPAVHGQVPAVPAAAEPTQWLPPVVELLVDPWAKSRVSAPEPRPRWLSRAREIVDPWADQGSLDPLWPSEAAASREAPRFAERAAPRVTKGSAKNPCPTIFYPTIF